MAHTIVIFGASGDLTSRKLIPALYELYRKKRLPEDTRDRRLLAHPVQPRGLAGRNLPRRPPTSSAERSTPRCGSSSPLRSSIHPGDIGKADDFPPLASYSGRRSKAAQTATRVYYLATAPQLYAPAVAQLARPGLAREDRGPCRVVIEKPFGTDLATARELNRKVHEVFAEHQVYRIDHYLGKETVQNLHGAAVCQQHLRAHLEPQLHRPRADHGGRGR